jgi:DNA-binding transcriptional LysR family regulator
MELYQLKTFVTVAEEGHLTRAAERLNSSQSAISAHIKALEAELGVILFDRIPKGMRLTAEGEHLNVKALSILEATEDLKYTAKALKGVPSGEVRIGLHTDSKILRIKDILDKFKLGYPNLRLSYHQKMSWQAPVELIARNLDVAFVYAIPEDERIEVLRLDQVWLPVVAPMKWKERLENVVLEDLLVYPWVWTNDRCPFYEVAETLFANIGKEPTKAVMVDEESAIEKLVSEGVGLSLMAEAKAKELALNGHLYVVNIPTAKIDLSLIYLKSRRQDPIISATRAVMSDLWDVDSSQKQFTDREESHVVSS